MTDTLKKFFKKNLEKNTEHKNENENGVERKWITYNEWGFQKSSFLNGNLLAFKGCLSLVKEHFLHSQGLDATKKERDISNAKTEIEKIDIDIENQKSLIETFKSKIVEWKDKIESVKKEVIGIEENPSSIMKDKISKVGFIIGLLILLFLTVYLFIFYSSASYSGFFKDFTEDLGDGVASAIFDPQAISKALKAGVTEVVLILTIPFIFLGLGYLIHKFQEGKGFAKYVKIASMIFVTFGFDALLAYKIEKGLYEVERINDPTGSMPLHHLSMALDSENFWLVIFAGFIVYIVWGFIFDFVMDAYDKLDVVKQAINSRKKEIKIHEEKIDKNQKSIQVAEATISEFRQKKAEQEKIVRGDTTIIDWSGFQKELHNFASGWASWMTQNGVVKQKIDAVFLALDEFVLKQQTEKAIRDNN